MAIKMSVAVRNAMMNAYETTIGTSPKLRIYTGNPPAAVTAAATGVMVCEIELPSDWLTAAENGVISKNGEWAGTASADGIAGYYRILNNAGTVTHEQGTVATSGGDMLINNTNVAVGQSITVTSYTKTAGNA